MKQLFITIILILSALISACRRSIDENDVVARVGSTILSSEELSARMSREGYQPDRESDFVNRWINRELLYQEAVRLHLDEDADLQLEMELVKKEFLIQKLLEKTFNEKLLITEEEIAAYYNENSADFEVLQDEAKIQHLLTKTIEEARLALQEINAGKEFSAVAKERSVGIFKDVGGNVGFICKKDVAPEVEHFVFRNAVGRTSGIISSPYGYHIIKVLDKRSTGTIKPLEEVRNEIWQRLRTIKENQLYYDTLYELQNRNEYSINKNIHTINDADSVSASSQEY